MEYLLFVLACHDRLGDTNYGCKQTFFFFWQSAKHSYISVYHFKVNYMAIQFTCIFLSSVQL